MIAAKGLRRPAYVLLPVLLPLVLWQRAGQEPEGNAGEEQEGRWHQEAQPPGAHPAGILGGDGHAFWGLKGDWDEESAGEGDREIERKWGCEREEVKERKGEREENNICIITFSFE